MESVAGLISDEETIALKKIDGRIIQGTIEQVHVIQDVKVTNFQRKVSGMQITDTQILISSGRNMFLLTLDCKVIRPWTMTTLPEEITCLDINNDTIALGLWNGSVPLISFSTNAMTQIDTLSIPARSIVLTYILPTQTLLIGSRDGTITTYSRPLSSPSDKKAVYIGTQSLRLFPLTTPFRNLIFATSNNLTLLHVPFKRNGTWK